MSFYRERPVKAVRRARRCLGCSALIEIGEPALDCSGHWEGEFWSGTFHTDCRAAEIALNKLHDLGGEDWVSLSELDDEDWRWLLEEFPGVAARKGITQARIAKAAADREESRKYWAGVAAAGRAR